MYKIVSYLNERNLKYAMGSKDYQWKALSDNCTHTIYNALAQADMVNPRLIRAGSMRQFFNLAVPANAVAAITELSSPDPLPDIKKIQKNRRLRATLLNYHWLPMRHGVLISFTPMYKKNGIYKVTNPNFETLLLRTRTFKFRRSQLYQVFSDARFTDLCSNLE